MCAASYILLLSCKYFPFHTILMQPQQHKAINVTVYSFVLVELCMLTARTYFVYLYFCLKRKCFR